MRFPYPLCGLAAAALLALPASAQVVDDVEPSASAAADVIDQRGAPLAKDGPLARLDDALRRLSALPPSRRADDEFVVVDAVATSPAAVGALRARLVALGFEPTEQAGAVVSGRLPVSAIGAAAEIPSLRSILVPRYVRHGADGTDELVPLVSTRQPAGAASARVGAVTGEASRALRAERARQLFGVTGEGVRIGVLSDSYDNCGVRAGDTDPDNDCRTTAEEDMETGDLPDDVLVLDDLNSGVGSDEGRAMMQLAYDVAPGTAMAFHTAFEGYISFAGGVIDLYQAGSQVVVDDIGISTDPFFQDGLIAQAIDYIVSQGGTYFSSAGNSADASYEADYGDSGQELVISFPNEDPLLPPNLSPAGTLHDFDPSDGVDAFQDVLMFPGETLRFTFQYDEPSILASVDLSPYPELIGGAPGQAPTSDYDVFVLDTPAADVTVDNILAASTRNNPVFGAPYEFIAYTNTTGAPQTVYVAITKFDGEDRRLKYINFGGTRFVIQEAEYVEPGTSTVFGHSNAEGTFATGAAAWFNTAPFSAFVASIEPVVGPAIINGFSSYGGLDIRLDINGNRLAVPEDRMKPDATSSDGDNNTFFGGDSGADADTFPNFFGTSAAAPNAAGVAALALEATDYDASPEAVYGALEETAADLTPGFPIGRNFNVGSGPGFDDQTGFGFIRADAALLQLAGGDIALSPASSVLFTGFDADGVGSDLGEFVALTNDSEDRPVDLSGGTFVVFNPFSERVTFAAQPDVLLAPGETFVFANEGGDLALPPGTLPDGPGAFALVTGDAAPGDRVRSVLGRVVAAVVYFNDDRVFGRVRGGDGAARTGTDLEGLLAEARASVEGGEIDLSVTARPNPSSGQATVAFGVAEAGDVRVAVYDALGREVAVLARGSFEPGRHAVAFDGSAFPAGVYVVRVSGAETQTTRLTVVR